VSVTEMSMFPFLVYASIATCLLLYYFPKGMTRIFWTLDFFLLVTIFFAQIESGRGVSVPLTRDIFGLSLEKWDIDNDGYITIDEYLRDLGISSFDFYKSQYDRDLESLAEEREELELEKDKLLLEKMKLDTRMRRYDFVSTELKARIKMYERNLKKLNIAEKSFRADRENFYATAKSKVDLFSFDYFEAYSFIISGLPSNAYDLYDDVWNGLSKNEWKMIHLYATSYIMANNWTNHIEVWDEVKELKYDSLMEQMEEGILDVPQSEETLVKELMTIQVTYSDLSTESIDLTSDEYESWFQDPQKGKEEI
jgi:hypothetical protein